MVLDKEHKDLLMKMVLDKNLFIMNYAFKLTRNEDGQKELRQEVYFKILLFLNKEQCEMDELIFSQPKLFMAWLGTVILNA